MSTILIKNAQVIDGTGQAPYKSDILIKNEKISAIDQLINFEADENIDAMGAYVSPGFIDINNASDRYIQIFSENPQKYFLLQGITTVIGGQGGISLAPLLYGSLQSLRTFSDVGKININWHTFSEFFENFKKQPLAINFGTFAGLTTIYRALIGQAIARPLNSNETKIINSILKESFKAGAFGLSVNLNHFLTSQISYYDLKKIIENTAVLNAVFSVNLKDLKENIVESVKKIVYLAKETGAKVIINDFLPHIGFEKSYREALKIIEENSGYSDVYFNLYPCAGHIEPVSEYLPKWLKGSREEILKNISDPDAMEKIISEFHRLKPKEMSIINAPYYEHLRLIGQSLEEFSNKRNLSVKEGLLEIMKITKLRAEILVNDINLEESIEALLHEKALPSHSNIFLAQNYCQPFSKFLEIAEKEENIPLEKAIFKITSLPAQKLGIEKRGEIKEGYYADLVVFKDSKISNVILNGQKVVKDNEYQNILAGKIIKKQ